MESVSYTHLIAYSEKTRHNTITPIVRKKNGMYEIDLVLRNNRTSEKYPDGIFHPHQNLHHIKKENIGLIEVMGLAVLPARLKDELEILKECLLGNKNILEISNMQKHVAWYKDVYKRQGRRTWKGAYQRLFINVD